MNGSETKSVRVLHVTMTTFPRVRFSKRGLPFDSLSITLLRNVEESISDTIVLVDRGGGLSEDLI